MSPLNLVIWCLYGVAFGCVLTFIAERYETYMSKRQHCQELRPLVKLIKNFSISRRNPSLVPAAVVRGYDSEELFREDLWLRRIAESRQRLAAKQLFTSQASDNANAQFCAMLVQHAGAASNN